MRVLWEGKVVQDGPIIRKKKEHPHTDKWGARIERDLAGRPQVLITPKLYFQAEIAPRSMIPGHEQQMKRAPKRSTALLTHPNATNDSRRDPTRKAVRHTFQNAQPIGLCAFFVPHQGRSPILTDPRHDPRQIGKKKIEPTSTHYTTGTNGSKIPAKRSAPIFKKWTYSIDLRQWSHWCLRFSALAYLSWLPI